MIIRTVGVVDYAASSAGGSAGTVTSPTISGITFSEVLATSVKVHCSVTDAKGYSTTGLRFRIYKKLPTATDYIMYTEDISIGEIGIGISTSMVNLSISTAYDVKIELYDKNSPSFTTVVKTATITTGTAYIETPTISISGYPNMVPINPTLTAPAFTPVGASDTYVSTTFRIKQGTSIVWTSTVNGVSVTVPAGQLVPNTAYTFEVIHTGKVLGNSAAGSLSATTTNALSVNIITVDGGSSGYENPVDVTSQPGPGGEIRRGNIIIKPGSSLAVIVGAGGPNSSGVPTSPNKGGVSSVTGFNGDVYPGTPNANGVILSDVDGQIYSRDVVS